MGEEGGGARGQGYGRYRGGVQFIHDLAIGLLDVDSIGHRLRCAYNTESKGDLLPRFHSRVIPNTSPLPPSLPFPDTLAQ